MTRALRVAGVAVATLSCVALAFATLGAEDPSDTLIGMAWPVPNIVVGLLLTVRRPRLLTGWLFAAIGFLVTTGAATERLAISGLEGGGTAPWWAVGSVWYGEWYWLPLIYTTLIFIPLLFPDGRPPSPRWRPVTIAAAVSLGALVVTAALQERLDTLGETTSVANPIGIAGLTDVEEGILAAVLLAVTGTFLVAALAGLVVRFRRSSGVERQQLKWFTSGAVVLIVGFMLQGLVEAVFGTRIGAVDIVLFAVTPLAAGIAILRYRLYAIDRIISRTVTYGLVTALLVAVYAAAVAVISAAVDPLAGESPLAVAIATLLAAALFRPALNRIRSGVDRRFNRQRYDAGRTIAAFRDRVRNDVNIESLTSDLVQVAEETFEPRVAVVWLRQAGEVRA